MLVHIGVSLAPTSLIAAHIAGTQLVVCVSGFHFHKGNTHSFTVSLAEDIKPTDFALSR